MKSIIVVPTLGYQSSEIINNFIIRINNQTIKNIDIVVINNNTEKLSIIQVNNKGNIYIINPGKNMGSAGGFYLGMKYAHENIGNYEFIILADDDAILLSNDVLEKLLINSHEKHIAKPLRKDLSDICNKDITTSLSCYGCIHNSIIKKYGYYSPVFFYGGEDSYYGEKISPLINCSGIIGTYYSHPYKTFLSSSRGSAGLSSFVFNSILLNCLLFFNKRGKYITSILSLMYWYSFMQYMFIFSTSYIQKRIFTNLRNICMYIPPLIGKEKYIVQYDNDQDEVVISHSVNNTKYDTYFQTYPYQTYPGNMIHKNGIIAIIDSWIPINTIYNSNTFVILLFQKYISIEFIHNYDKENNIIATKKIIDFKTTIKKYIYILLGIVFAPLIILLSVCFSILTLIKYGIIIVRINFSEKKITRNIYNNVEIISK